MFEDSVSSSIPSIWASMNSWFTPPVLFVLLNLMIVTIAFTSSFVSQKQQQSHPQAQENPYQHHRMVRSPSVLERLKSINLYAYRSPEPHPSPPLAAAFSPAPDSATHYVSEQTHEPQSSEPATRLVFEEEEEEPKSLDEVYSQLEGHHFDRTRSESEPASGKMPERLPAKIRKSASAKSAFAHFEEEDIVGVRRPATMREGKAAAEVDDEVDAKADDFINKFKQQLKLQRLDSILGYKEMIARGSAK
ncbi:pathogen-associated molecular patterns-induced protein A70 [Diospyros lotus]|uniref:pathogen-associated molecular patterns-induced protein A70 n=1 Tax=Diospyros lotus TaxID=55363 RepID=UPI00224C8F37|nr:pathogen-associated molecular patterns-induced protein A70 [Diospyros lotus]